MTPDRVFPPRTKTVSHEQQLEPHIALTPMQHKCLELAAKGFTAAAAGAVMGRSVKTVETHFANCRYKLDATNTTEACCIAIRKGLIA